MVSRPEVFASLLPRLAQGYALDALSGEERPVDQAVCEAFLRSALAAPRADLPTPGLGRGLALAGVELVGSGLEHDDELVQLSAFTAADQSGPSRPGEKLAHPASFAPPLELIVAISPQGRLEPDCPRRAPGRAEGLKPRRGIDRAELCQVLRRLATELW